jgi:hypothetical protein
MANKTAKKALNKKPASTTTKVKKAAPTVLSQRKVSTKARPRAKPPVRGVVVVPPKEVVVLRVVVGKTSSRTITLPQRFR